jgi:hypothetical protein
MWTVNLPPWLTMVVIALTIYFVLKGISLIHFERHSNRRLTIAERLAWLFTWPGMNARHFFCPAGEVTKPPSSAWLWAIGELLFGAVLLVVVAPEVVDHHELAGGWVAMIGILFLLHFGLLHLAALFWRRAGRPVEPIMRAPVLASSLDEFWSRRWNLAFADFARIFLFRPLARRLGAAMALMTGFIFSGLIHDLAISVPARGGYGLPTAYFLLQSLGVFVERSAWGRSMGLGRGWRGRMFAICITAPAAYLLFHPPFVHEVIVPLIPWRGTEA